MRAAKLRPEPSAPAAAGGLSPVGSHFRPKSPQGVRVPIRAVHGDLTADRAHRWIKTSADRSSRTLAPFAFSPRAPPLSVSTRRSPLSPTGLRRQRRRAPPRRARPPATASNATVPRAPLFPSPHCTFLARSLLSRPQRPDPAPQATPARRARAERRAVAGPLRAIHFPLPTFFQRERGKQRGSAGLPHSFSARVRGARPDCAVAILLAGRASALVVSAPPSRDLVAVCFAPRGVVLRPRTSACRCVWGSRGTGAAGVAAHFAGGPRPSPVYFCFLYSALLGFFGEGLFSFFVFFLPKIF